MKVGAGLGLIANSSSDNSELMKEALVHFVASVDPNLRRGRIGLVISFSGSITLENGTNFDIVALGDIDNPSGVRTYLGLGVASRKRKIRGIGNQFQSTINPLINVGFYKPIGKAVEPFGELKFYMLNDSAFFGAIGVRWNIAFQ